MALLRQMKLVSNNIGYGPCPDPTDEVEQYLTLTADGIIWFTSYCYGTGEPNYKVNVSRQGAILSETAQRVLNLIGTYFKQRSVQFDVTDVGVWTLTLTDENGVEEEYKGSLCDGYELDGQNLSDILREALQMPYLIAFDARGEEARIDRITLDYHRVLQISRDSAFGPDIGTMEIEITERLRIDRVSSSIELYRKSGAGFEVRNSYRFFEGVDTFLDRYDEDLFSEMSVVPDDAVENQQDKRFYALSVEFSSGKRVEWSGYYDKFGVPVDLQFFLSGLSGFLSPYGRFNMFNPDIYRGSNRVREPELIFCSCAFKRGGQTYYYLTDDDTLQEGDFVWVPAGKDNHEKVVRIEEIDVCPEDAPLFCPYETKRILRRCEKDEIPEEWTTFDPPTFFCSLIEREVTPEECEGICLVVQNGFDPSILDRFTPPIEVDLSQEAKCWQCDNPWLNS